MYLAPPWLSLLVAGAAVLLLAPTGIVAARWLAYGRPFPGKSLLETVLLLPLVLPPTVVGYYLLLALGRGTPLGRWLNDWAGIRLLFTWQGAALASAVMAFPLFVRSAQAAFGNVEHDLLEAGRAMGAGETRLLFCVVLPLSYRGLLAGLSLACARAVGEFGATLMVGGSIPGRTETLPLALYTAVQSGDDHLALIYTAMLTIGAFLLLVVLGTCERRMTLSRG